MILSPAAEASAFVELRFEPGTWKSHGIPEAGCRLRINTMTAIIADGGAYQVEQLMLG